MLYLFLQLKKERIGRHVSRVVDFYCFDVPVSYRKEINAKSLREVGVKSPFDVGDKLVEIFKKKFKQENVATKLQDHLLALRSPSSPKPRSTSSPEPRSPSSPEPRSPSSPKP